jgi:hypothetical protein
MFRDLKQNLSFGKLPTQGKNGANLAVCFPILLYNSLNLEHKTKWGLKSHEPTGKMIQKIIQKEWRRTVEVIIKKPDSKVVSKYKSRNHESTLTKKPTDGTVEKFERLKLSNSM